MKCGRISCPDCQKRLVSLCQGLSILFLAEDCDTMVIRLMGMSQTQIASVLDLCRMKNAKQVATTSSMTIVKNVSDISLSPEEYSVYRTAARKLLWLALIRGDIACATKELSRDVTGPTM